MEEEQTKFIDAETYTGQGQEKLTFRDIVLSHLKKIGTLASVEFRGGYWDEKAIHTSSVTNIIRTYIPDTREVYSNSIDYLHDLLYPHFDKKMLEASKKAEEEDSIAFEEMTHEATREDETPEEEKKYRKFSNVKERVAYRDMRVKINRKLFRELCCFLERKKYLKSESFEDEV